MSKIKTITLAHGIPDRNDPTGTVWLYRVEKVTDATSPSPGDILTKKQADELCAAKDWKVTIVPFPR